MSILSTVRTCSQWSRWGWPYITWI